MYGGCSSGWPLTASFGPSVSSPGSSATFVPAASAMLHAAVAATAAFFFCSSSTRTVETGAGPSVVPV